MQFARASFYDQPLPLMEIVGIPVRDVVVSVCILIAIYVAVTMLRLMRLRRHKAPAEEAPPRVFPTVDFELDGDDEADAVDTLVYSRPVASPPPPRPQPPEAREASSFDAELGRSQLEREVRQLREEIAALRAELDEMKAASRVSPQYADAMALVQRGLTAQDVADRCGISLAEAELVWALAQGPQDTEQEDEYGGASGRNPARPAG